MKHYVLIIVVVLFFMGFELTAVELNLLKTIGDEREDYTFFILNGAVLTKNKEIFVLDGQGFFIAKYDWSGKFLKKAGSKGQGPGDLYFPRSLNYCSEKIYVLDTGNKRIAEVDLDLEEFNYYKFNPKNIFDKCFFALPNGTFIGSFSNIKEGRGRIGIVDKKGDVLHSFFSKFPIDLNVDISKFSEKENLIWQVRRVVFSKETDPIIAIDEEKKKLFISFNKPSNPVLFFIYSINGELIKEFSYQLDSKYKFLDFYVNAKSLEEVRDINKYPSKSFVPFIYSLFIYNDNYIVLLWLQEYSKKELVSQTSYLLVFDSAGKLAGKLQVDNDLRIFSISKDGYILAGMSDEEITKVYIYRLKL